MRVLGVDVDGGFSFDAVLRGRDVGAEYDDTSEDSPDDDEEEKSQDEEDSKLVPSGSFTSVGFTAVS